MQLVQFVVVCWQLAQVVVQLTHIPVIGTWPEGQVLMQV
jgi:hypothetical protein